MTEHDRKTNTMNKFSLGQEWRQAAAESPAVEEGHDVVIHVQDGVRTYWVREEPVPLPTEPYTVIRVTGRPSYDDPIFFLRPGGEWCNALDAMFLSPSDLRESITGFEVLAEPRKEPDREAEYAAVRDVVRRETAKAVAELIEQGASPNETRSHYGVDK